MKALSMYSGGCDGISLAASWVGIQTLAHCDSDAACRAVLGNRYPETPIFTNDEEVTPDALRAHGIDPTSIDIIFGGPPCQIASLAGKRRGAGDERNRWPQYLATIRAIRPRWVLAENVPGLLSVQNENGIKGGLFGNILSSLAQMGYGVGWCCYGAADVGAPHKRERLFIVGYTEHTGFPATQIGSCSDPRDDNLKARALDSREPKRSGTQSGIMADSQSAGLPQWNSRAGGTSEHAKGLERRGAAMEYTNGQRRETYRAVPDREKQKLLSGEPDKNGSEWATESRLGGDIAGLSGWLDEIADRLAAQRWPSGRGEEQYSWEPLRVASEIPDRATRIRMIGNSCPPQQYAVILSAIVGIDRLIYRKKGDAYTDELP